MKKLVAILLAGTMAVSLAACAAAAPAPAEPAAAEETAEEAVEAAEETAEAAEITTVEPGVLTMATNAYFPPYEYYEGDAIVGIDAEIAAAVAEKLGLELKIEDMEVDSIITAVTSG